MKWFLVKCARCVAKLGGDIACAVLRVEITSDPIPTIEVRHTGRSGVRWVSLGEDKRGTYRLVACDHGHVGGVINWAKLRRQVVDAIGMGAEYALVDLPANDPGRHRNSLNQMSADPLVEQGMRRVADQLMEVPPW